LFTVAWVAVPGAVPSAADVAKSDRALTAQLYAEIPDGWETAFQETVNGVTTDARSAGATKVGVSGAVGGGGGWFTVMLNVPVAD
jgi:hypothetical protein